MLGIILHLNTQFIYEFIHFLLKKESNRFLLSFSLSMTTIILDGYLSKDCFQIDQSALEIF